MDSTARADAGIDEVTLKVVTGMDSFSREEWSQLAGASQSASTISYNPFISHDFLSIVEESGTVSPRTGWQPQHLRLEAGDGTLLGAAPCYLKSHSQGEYVFDDG